MNMRRETTSWFSHNLGMDMPLVAYGTSGYPLLMFPTAAADYLEYERFYLVDAIKDLIEAGRAIGIRRRDLAEQMVELKGLRGKNTSVIKHMRARIEQEQADFDASGAKIHAVRSVHLKLLRDVFKLLGTATLKTEMAGLTNALRQPGIKLGVRKAYGQTFDRLREGLRVVGFVPADGPHQDFSALVVATQIEGKLKTESSAVLNFTLGMLYFQNDRTADAVKQFCLRNSGKGIVVLITDLMDKGGYEAALRMLLQHELARFAVHCGQPFLCVLQPDAAGLGAASDGDEHVPRLDRLRLAVLLDLHADRVAVARRGVRVRRGDDHQVERGHDEDELPAVAPRVVHVVPRRLADPPAVAVHLAADPRAPAGHRRRDRHRRRVADDHAGVAGRVPRRAEQRHARHAAVADRRAAVPPDRASGLGRTRSGRARRAMESADPRGDRPPRPRSTPRGTGGLPVRGGLRRATRTAPATAPRPAR